MNISPARRAAFEILRRVEAEQAHSSALLASFENQLGSEDRALCHELVLGVLRRRLWLDRLIENLSKRSVAGLDLPVRLALRLGLYQLRFLSRIPPSAAVNESVNLIRTSRIKSAAGLVNAVLRRAAREPEHDPVSLISDPIERLTIEESHPRWLIDRWVANLGFDQARTLAKANNQPAPLSFRLTRKSRNDTSVLDEIKSLEAKGVISASQFTDGAWRVNRETDGGRQASKLLRAMARDGQVYFQDEASQLVARLLHVKDGDRVLDSCAAPGSKTTHLASIVPGAEIFAGDHSEGRLRTLRELAILQGITTINMLIHDAEVALPFAQGSFDCVLVDAPCSGTGTLRQNPEIRWRLTPADLSNLSERQGRILENAAAMVTPEGMLLYSTCSLETEENEMVVENFLRRHAEFQMIALPGPPELAGNLGTVRTWPHRNDVDGFFIAGLRRTTATPGH